MIVFVCLLMVWSVGWFGWLVLVDWLVFVWLVRLLGVLVETSVCFLSLHTLTLHSGAPLLLPRDHRRGTPTFGRP